MKKEEAFILSKQTHISQFYLWLTIFLCSFFYSIYFVQNISKTEKNLKNCSNFALKKLNVHVHTLFYMHYD